MPKPDLAAIPEFYHKYVRLVKEEDAVNALAKNKTDALSFLQAIPEEKWSFRYAEGKWSVKEKVQHLIDTERIFSYRALCISRGEQASLPGFDENRYAATSEADRRNPDDLLNEWEVVRQGTLLLFRSFTDSQLLRKGTANNKPIDVNSIGFITVGHMMHHLNILADRYVDQQSSAV